MIGRHPVKCWTVAPEAAGVCVGSNPTSDRHIYFACIDRIRSHSCTRNDVNITNVQLYIIIISQHSCGQHRGQEEDHSNSLFTQ